MQEVIPVRFLRLNRDALDLPTPAFLERWNLERGHGFHPRWPGLAGRGWRASGARCRQRGASTRRVAAARRADDRRLRHLDARARRLRHRRTSVPRGGRPAVVPAVTV